MPSCFLDFVIDQYIYYREVTAFAVVFPADTLPSLNVLATHHR